MPRADQDETTDEDADPMDEAKDELEDDDVEVIDRDGRLTYHKGKKRTVEEIEQSVINSPEFKENTRRGGTRFNVVVEKESMNAENPIEGEAEIECYPTPRLDKGNKGVAFIPDEHGDYIKRLVRYQSGKTIPRYTQLSEVEIEQRDVAQAEYKRNLAAENAQRKAAKSTGSGKRRKLGGV